MSLTRAPWIAFLWLLQLNGTLSQVYNIPSQCYPIADHCNEIVQSIGLNANALCPATGLYSKAKASLTSCLNLYSGSGDRQVATLLSTADLFCLSQVNAGALATATSAYYSSSVCCNTDTGAQLLVGCPTTRTYVPSTDPNCVFFLLARASATGASVTGIVSGVSSTAQSGQSVTTTSAIQSPSASSTPNVQSTNSNSGLVVGAAVGGSLGFVILVLVTLFIFWHRRQHKREFKREQAVEQARLPERAQLHSVDYKPQPKELSGAPLMTVRSVGGLEEMEAHQWRGQK